MNFKKNLSLISKLPPNWSAYYFGWPKLLPVNLTINFTYSCNSRCLTCNVWRERVKELSLEEWKKIFKKIGPTPYWLTISGGEPFLRKNLAELAKAAHQYLRPAVINIPTNGLLYQIIPQEVEKILKRCPDSEIVINFSLDGIGKDHDRIRNIPGNFEKLLKSYQSVKKLKKKYCRLTVGFHTVISKYNVSKIPEICDFVLSLEPDQYITEIAEERVELGTIGRSISPSLKDYSRAIDYVSKMVARRKFYGLAKITEALRLEYYRLVKIILREKTQVVPCYAGLASAQISADGEVWPCCVRADNLGNLADHDYDFAQVWFGERAKTVRKSIKNKECYCPLANASYTNILLNPKILAKVIFNLVK